MILIVATAILLGTTPNPDNRIVCDTIYKSFQYQSRIYDSYKKQLENTDLSIDIKNQLETAKRFNQELAEVSIRRLGLLKCID